MANAQEVAQKKELENSLAVRRKRHMRKLNSRTGLFHKASSTEITRMLPRLYGDLSTTFQDLPFHRGAPLKSNSKTDWRIFMRFA